MNFVAFLRNLGEPVVGVVQPCRHSTYLLRALRGRTDYPDGDPSAQLLPALAALARDSRSAALLGRKDLLRAAARDSGSRSRGARSGAFRFMQRLCEEPTPLLPPLTREEAEAAAAAAAASQGRQRRVEVSRSRLVAGWEPFDYLPAEYPALAWLHGHFAFTALELAAIARAVAEDAGLDVRPGASPPNAPPDPEDLALAIAVIGGSPLARLVREAGLTEAQLFPGAGALLGDNPAAPERRLLSGGS